MKNWIKRFSCFALVLMMLFSMAACGTNSNPVGTQPSEGTVTPSQGTENNETIPPSTEQITDESLLGPGQSAIPPTENEDDNTNRFDYNFVPPYTNKAFYTVNDGMPYFTEEEMANTETFETYSDLDSLGRCGVAYANIHKSLMPTEDRESLSSVTPSGWKNKQYDSALVDGGWVYNRAHLIGFQLAGEQANEKNLITGTRYCNVQGMLPFENMIADYIKETNNHVLYRVTPVYVGNELVARGVLMEAYSIEDEGDGICYNVFCYNVQPGIFIDYATGDNFLMNEHVAEPDIQQNMNPEAANEKDYVVNLNTQKFHNPDCSSVPKISEMNREDITTTRESLIEQGYTPCGTCKP